MAAMRSQLVGLLLEFVRVRGGPAPALARAHRIPAACLRFEAPLAELPVLPVARIVALADACAAALADPWLGLHLAHWVPRGTYGAQEFAIRNGPTLGEAALRLVRYQRLTNDAVVWSAEQGRDHATLAHHVPGSPQALGRQLNEFSMAVVQRFVLELGGARPREVRFAHAAPGDPAPLAEWFGGARLAFRAERNALLFEPEQWSARVTGADPSLLAVLDSYASTLVPKEPPAASWSSRLREHLRLNLNHTARLKQAAQALGIPARSLQRRLDEEGTSFAALLDQLRHEQARRLLSDPERSIDEISFLLGFAERRAFLRAFRRWEGCAPSAFRQRSA